ncbi:MAG: phosphatidate cytidylyltransferase, partial [Gemmatimonadetes bacterium]|nr:phosphatidate cytidylyltransferase [Gemmatimonadota bacterium]NIS02872.1 phosphatidate cytidylyltransferase [Gemmatimonadota bacterium]NIT68581.1 phosphatidate cytidylyltransferase [Gemmatimonadota bacterium]NIV25296.1 phosphatidate cytidylyltransferase [Gemmatimonadota bacterium]NIW77300.1 phosphatidate cytidylyltransferase [Gemmatimonadota bacterium]
MRSGLHPNVLFALAGVFAILVIASFVTWWLRRARPTVDLTEIVQRVRSWWIMAAVFALAMILSRNVTLVFFALVSFLLALKEYLSLIPTRRVDRSILLWAYLAIPVQYLWIGMEWYGMFIIFIPVYIFLFIPMRMVLIGETAGFLRA